MQACKNVFFCLIHVENTAASTLKNGIFFVQSIRLQGYDGASSLCGEWNGLEALISSECPYAYYVHCLAHRLQLTLVAASKEIIHVHQFFYQVELHCQYCWSIM